MTEQQPRPGLLARMKIPALSWIDVTAILGLVLMTIGIAILVAPAAALVVVGLALLAYAIAVSAAAQ